MSDNKNLHSAKTAQKDEFYTQFEDIVIEMNAYLEYDKNVFRDKVIFCNCDDPYESNFFKYFALYFNNFGLKKLIATCYSGSPVAGTQLSLFDEPTDTDPQRTAYKVIINEVKDFNGDGAVDLKDIELLLSNENNVATELEGNGDFRSKECVELLKQADIVVTNPPFSLFRDYIAQLMKYNKKFIIIGNQNAITYKEIFPLIKDNRMWLGNGFAGGAAHFISNYKDFAVSSNHKQGMIRVSGVNWFTNLPLNKRFEPMQLMTKADNLRFNKQLNKALNKFSSLNYPKYDNYNAIEIPVTSSIPKDYKGVMGVPITFLDKYCPKQFEIVELGNSRENFTPIKDYINPIKHLKNGSTANGGAINCVLAINQTSKPENTVYYTSDNSDYLVPPYARILIKYTEEWIKQHPEDFKE